MTPSIPLLARSVRNATRVMACCALAVLTVVLIPGAKTQSSSQPPKPELPRPQIIPGEIIVRFSTEPLAKSAAKQTQQLKLKDRQIAMRIQDLDVDGIVSGLRIVLVEPAETMEAIEALGARSDVLYAEPNYLRERFVTPNDPLYSNLWGLRNNGCIFGNCGFFQPGFDVRAEQAWNITTGSRSVVVGIVDGGVYTPHADLQPNIWINPAEIAGNNIDDDGNGFIDDVNGYDFFHNRAELFDPGDLESENHATHVAGTIGAVGNNTIGVVGVNWQVSLMSLKIFGRENETPFPSSVAVLVRAYNYAKKMRDLWISTGGTKGANLRVLNNSIGGYGRSQAEFDAVKALNDSGVLFVAAAGNHTRNNDVFPIYPAGYELPNVISVAATTLNGDALANFSNVGARTVTLSAPGQSIQSTIAFGNYGTLDGTSMASPHVAGAAALICSAYPSITVDKLRAAVIYNGDPVASQEYKTLTARRLNIYKSLLAAAENDTTSPGSIGDFRILARNGRTLTLGWTAPGDDGLEGASALYDIRYSTTDLSSPQQFEAATSISPLGIPLPLAGGSLQSAIVDVPFRHSGGFIGLRATDNMGNTGPIAVVQISLDGNVPGQYDVTQSSPQPLSSGGTAVNMFGLAYPDDGYSRDYALPFDFPYFGSWVRNINISLNGAIYFSTPPKFLLPPMTGKGGPLDAFSSIRALQTNAMIAGMWDDLYITGTGGVYAVSPDANRIIFRWEGETFDTPFDDGTSRGKHPIKFEIEMRRDGTIQFRYGDGNQRLFPVVGISGGGPDAYVVNSHTSETPFKSLTNANTVTFTPHVAPAPTSSDLSLTLLGQTVNADAGGGGIVLPGAVIPGQTLQYSVAVTALGPDPSDNVVLTSQLPAGTSFVRCLGVSCSGPPAGTDGGTVTVNFGTLGNIYDRRSGGASIQVVVNASVGTTLTNTFSISTSTSDPNLANNTVTAITLVAGYSPFGNVAAVDGARLYTIALRQDGSVWSWGIPFGSAESSVFGLTTPKRVEGLSNIIAIAAGEAHAVALKADGTVWTWGDNQSGQLGNGSTSFFVSPPTAVPGLSNIQSIAASLSSSFAVASDGTVWAWGENSGGQLGDGTTTNRPAPVHLASISGVRSVAANKNCTFAIKNDGSVWSWGENSSGLLGTGSSAGNSLIPARVAQLTNVRAIATWFVYAAAVQEDGSVWIWGSWGNNVPRKVNELSGVVGIGIFNLSKLLALKADGTVWSWEQSGATSRIVGLDGVKAVRGWASGQAAIMHDDTLRMWGFNGYGQLGNGGFAGGAEPGAVQWLTVVFPPTFSPSAGFSVFPRNVVVACETEGAVIHYTTNGNDPTESDPVVASGSALRIDQTLVLKAKAWKNGWSPSAVVRADYVILTSPPPLVLLEANTVNQALALDSLTFVRGPFRVLTNNNLSEDRHTRLILFTSNLGLTQPDLSILRVQAAGFDLAVESVGTLSGIPGLDASYLIVRLPDGLPAGDLPLTISVRGISASNAPTITIAP